MRSPTSTRKKIVSLASPPIKSKIRHWLVGPRKENSIQIKKKVLTHAVQYDLIYFLPNAISVCLQYFCNYFSPYSNVTTFKLTRINSYYIIVKNICKWINNLIDHENNAWQTEIRWGEIRSWKGKNKIISRMTIE